MSHRLQLYLVHTKRVRPFYFSKCRISRCVRDVIADVRHVGDMTCLGPGKQMSRTASCLGSLAQRRTEAGE